MSDDPQMPSLDDFCEQAFNKPLPHMGTMLNELRHSYVDLLEIRAERCECSQRLLNMGND